MLSLSTTSPIQHEAIHVHTILKSPSSKFSPVQGAGLVSDPPAAPRRDDTVLPPHCFTAWAEDAPKLE